MNPPNPLQLDDAFRKGNLAALKAAFGVAPDAPDAAWVNADLPGGFSAYPLEYAIYHSPLPFVRTLLALGADAGYESPGGFPAVIAALSSERPDRLEIVELLLSHGADLQRRGVNGWTPLHWAAAGNDVPAVQWLLAHGADPTARTNVDDYATPLEEAELLGQADAAAVLRAHTQD